jgi:hypothetical protein
VTNVTKQILDIGTDTLYRVTHSRTKGKLMATENTKCERCDERVTALQPIQEDTYSYKMVCDDCMTYHNNRQQRTTKTGNRMFLDIMMNGQ